MVVAAKRCLRYLKGTQKSGLTYWTTWMQEGALTACPADPVAGWTDADWAGEQDTRKSTAGILLLCNGTAISWSSKTLKTVALSSQDAEYMALSDGSREIVFIRGVLELLGFKLESTRLHGDNNGSLAVSKNPMAHQKTKHIAVRYHYVRQTITEGQVNVVKVSTTEQLADLLTKALPTNQHQILTCRVSGGGGGAAPSF